MCSISFQQPGNNTAGIVRIPSNNDVWIKKALDTGAQVVMVPLVNSAEDGPGAPVL
jgi:2-keto-3-deoxy-L-rhamnonate aldolase RhmA